MNKQELIEKYEGEFPSIGMNISTTIKFKALWDDILELDESEKVTIPQCVAKFIEFKKKNNFHVYGAMRTIEDHYDIRIPNWFYEGNIEKFCLAWILGYEVEKEKRYIVTLKSSGQKLYYHTEDENYIFSSYDGVFYSEYHTKTDLEENGMSWVFDCPGMEIQEVE